MQCKKKMKLFLLYIAHITNKQMYRLRNLININNQTIKKSNLNMATRQFANMSQKKKVVVIPKCECRNKCDECDNIAGNIIGILFGANVMFALTYLMTVK